MCYQILYKLAGKNFAQTFYDEFQRDNFLKVLDNIGTEGIVIERDDRKFQLAHVVFKLEDIELVKKGERSTYTFADPEKHAKAGTVVKAAMINGEIKPVYVVSTEMKTVHEIQTLAQKLGRKKLCKIVETI